MEICTERSLEGANFNIKASKSQFKNERIIEEDEREGKGEEEDKRREGRKEEGGKEENNKIKLTSKDTQKTVKEKKSCC